MVKKFKDLNLNSAYLFAAALSDPETCRLVLEIIMISFRKVMLFLSVHLTHLGKGCINIHLLRSVKKTE